MGDEVLAFCAVCCTNCGVIVIPVPVCLDDRIGLTVMLLFTPAATGGVFDDDAEDAAVVATTLRAVTVRALFLLIAATASFVGSLCLVFGCGGLRIMAAIG